MSAQGVEFLRLHEEYEIPAFDCGDGDLNEFIYDLSKPNQKQLLTVTYLYVKEKTTIAFFSLINDKISREDVESGKQWQKRFQITMKSSRKKYKSYPAVKIGRLGVTKDYQGKSWGTDILNYIKGWFLVNNKTGCRFITVDAYLKSIAFYQKNGFEFLTTQDQNEDTRQMYFDLFSLV